jgi:hypothetical protein
VTAFFIVTQVLYTLGFVFLLFTVIGTLAIELCFITDREAFAMKVLSFVMFLSGEFGTQIEAEHPDSDSTHDPQFDSRCHMQSLLSANNRIVLPFCVSVSSFLLYNSCHRVRDLRR